MFSFGQYEQSIERDAAAYRDAALLGLIEAELACLANRQALAADGTTSFDLACQLRDAKAARRTLLRSRDRLSRGA